MNPLMESFPAVGELCGEGLVVYKLPTLRVTNSAHRKRMRPALVPFFHA
jgi:hypothetical protein